MQLKKEYQNYSNTPMNTPINKQQWEEKRKDDPSLPSWENKQIIDDVLTEQVNIDLQSLREEYKTADADRRRQIVIVANRIKQSANLYPVKVEEHPDTKFRNDVVNSLL